MKSILSAAVAISLSSTAWASDGKPKLGLQLDPSSRLELTGNSTLHPYAARAGVLLLFGGLEGDSLRGAMAVGGAADVVLRVPVAGLKSGRNALDDNLHAALKRKQHPDIVFALERFQLTPRADTLIADGQLTVAGRTRPLKLVAAVRFEGEAMRISGDASLRMTDFGIAPPTFFLGAMKTDDVVVVKFDLIVRPVNPHQTAKKEEKES